MYSALTRCSVVRLTRIAVYVESLKDTSIAEHRTTMKITIISATPCSRFSAQCFIVTMIIRLPTASKPLKLAYLGELA